MKARRAHVINADGSLIKRPDTVAEIIRPKRPSQRKFPWLKRLGLLVGIVFLVYVGIVGAKVLGVIGEIHVNNEGSTAPFLKFPKITPEALAGEGDGRINILLLGIVGKTHTAGSLADTIILVSIDPTNNKIAILSIPRDLYVTYPKPLSGQGKINAIHAYGEEPQRKIAGGGPEMMKKEVAQILDVPVHYFVRVDFDGFKKLVDTLGGVTVNVEKAIYDPLYPAPNMIDYSPFKISAGIHELDGDTALKFVRSRETTSDFDRAHRQQQIISAIKEKSLSLGVLSNPKKIVDILSVLGQHVKTDLTTSEMERLVKIVKDIQKENILSKVLDNGPDGPLVSENNGAYVLVPRSGDYKEIQKIAHEIFVDPFLDNEKATIAVQNASGVAGKGIEVSTLLKEYTYTVNNTVTASKVSKQSMIYDTSNGKKPATIELLKKRLGMSVSTTVPSDIQATTPNEDIIIVVGESYVVSKK